jgi:Domain of unknown function (DUF4303)
LNRSEFARVLQRAVVGALSDFQRQDPDESPYALAVILGQCGNYLGYAVATEEGLRRVASEYAAKGYRYQGWEWEEFDNLERLATWLRWANPDDGWQHRDFPDRFGVAPVLANLVEGRAFGEDAEQLEEFCTEVLAGLQSDADWLAVAGERVVVGVTFGSDPRDFLRTATRANRYGVVRELWAEHWRGEELSSKIPAPG